MSRVLCSFCMICNTMLTCQRTQGVIISCAEIPAEIHPRSQVHKDIIVSQFAGSRTVLKNFEHELPPDDAAFVQKW